MRLFLVTKGKRWTHDAFFCDKNVKDGPLMHPLFTVHGWLESSPPQTTTITTLSSLWSVGCAADKNHTVLFYTCTFFGYIIEQNIHRLWSLLHNIYLPQILLSSAPATCSFRFCFLMHRQPPSQYSTSTTLKMDMPQNSPRVPPMLEIMSTALTVAVLPIFKKESKIYQRIRYSSYLSSKNLVIWSEMLPSMKTLITSRGSQSSWSPRSKESRVMDPLLMPYFLHKQNNSLYLFSKRKLKYW